MSVNKRHIFVSHSSKDTKLIGLIELAFSNREIEPYFAGNRIEGKNPVDKIVEAISGSIGLFALITPNVVRDTHIHIQEIGLFLKLGLQKLRIFLYLAGWTKK